MSQVTQDFTEAGLSAHLLLKPGESADYSVSGTFTGFVYLERATKGVDSWEIVVAGDEDTGFSGTLKNETAKSVSYRFRAEDTDSETAMTGTAVCSIADADLNAEKRIVQAGGVAKVGATSGWAVAAAADTSLVTCPASQTAATLVVPITGLKPGDVIKGFHLIGQVESAGGDVTIDAALRKHTAAAADVADASVGAITQLAVTADTILSKTNTRKGALDEVVGEDETFYVLVTATTDASTDIALQGVAVEVVPA